MLNKLQITKINEDKQKIITISMIVSDRFCENIAPIFHQNNEIIYKNFTSFNRIIINWCIEYYNKYNKAPHNHIQDIFNSKKNQLKEEEQELVKKVLVYLSDKFERDENFNENYVIDQAKLFIREVNLNSLQEQINEAKKNNDIDQAEYLVLTYEKLEKETEKRQTTNILKDIDKAKEICDFELNQNADDRLFKLRGDLGKDLGWIYRGDFFTFAGRGKIGKSYNLREVAEIAAFDYGLTVFVFNLEMNHSKYVRNFYQSIANEIKEKEEKEIRMPYFKENEQGKYEIKYKSYNKKGLSGRNIEQKLKLTSVRTKGNIIIESFPSNTLYFNKIIKILDDYLLQGIVGDLLLIDFLDNTKTLYKGEFRHGIDDKWVNGRRLAQEKHIAVGTVTHTNISTFKTNVEPGKLSEDNRKYNHITHGIGINQLPEEKRNQYSRLNIIANRDGDFSPDRFYISLECRDIGKVMVDTKRMSDVILKD